MEGGNWGGGITYALLGEFARALVFAVAEEFDDAALVGGEAGGLEIG